MSSPSEFLNVDEAVRNRYAAAASQAEAALCCPVDYDAQYLDVIPAEIRERDYGCGDPSRYLQPGDHVLDLGSGGGKICYIAAQVVGPDGSVVGVDVNDPMLDLARRYQDEVAARIGYHNTDFRKGRIQDLKLNLERFEQHLQQHPVSGTTDWLAAEEYAAVLRETDPLVASDSIDAVVSNCVLNLVRHEDRRQLFAEVFRVLKPGGRAIISDIVSDEDVPPELQKNGELWSGCISGSFREDRFPAVFEEAGFCGIEILSRQAEPWAVVEGIEFRSLTVRAWKGKDGPRLDRHHAAVYNGPWKAVIDDAGQKLVRGQRMAVCDRTFQMYKSAPYASQVTTIAPAIEVPLEQAAEWNDHSTVVRSPKQSKRGRSSLTVIPGGDCCSDDGSCC